MTDDSRLAAAWRKAAEVLSIEVVVPYVLFLPSGRKVDAVALVKEFGAKNGMLIVTDYDQLRADLAAINEAGYGYSVLQEPAPTAPFDVEEYIDMLRDWGWGGRKEDEPWWLAAPATEFAWGDTVRVLADAPSAFRPGERAEVCGMREVTTEADAATLGCTVGTNVYLVEYGDGSAAELPAGYLVEEEG